MTTFEADELFGRFFGFRIDERVKIKHSGVSATVIGQIRLYDKPCYFLTPDNAMFDNGIYAQAALETIDGS